ncbi:MAG TPA: O-methyltransferase [Armatimonadota bacterium]|jgi:predicted O-methyltransferase YrrM
MADQESKIQGYDRYIDGLFAPEDEALRLAREDMQREGLPAINVSASEGKLLHVIALIAAPRRILEIGTLGGYSAIWLARALPADGRLISLEIDQHHADVARRNVERAGLAGRVEIRVGPAAESLARMAASGEAPFDLVFIDADKDAYVTYMEMALPMLREGGILLGDNTLPDAVLHHDGDSGTKRYNAAVAAHPGLVSINIPVLRGEHIDGLLVSVKRASSAG